MQKNETRPSSSLTAVIHPKRMNFAKFVHCTTHACECFRIGWMIVLASIGLCFTSVGLCQDAPTPLSSVKEGVYYFKNMYSTTVLELKYGQFRYWFRSDM